MYKKQFLALYATHMVHKIELFEPVTHCCAKLNTFTLTILF